MYIRGRQWMVKLIGSSWQHKVFDTSSSLSGQLTLINPKKLLHPLLNFLVNLDTGILNF